MIHFDYDPSDPDYIEDKPGLAEDWTDLWERYGFGLMLGLAGWALVVGSILAIIAAVKA